jgi:hypothetical protein
MVMVPSRPTARATVVDLKKRSPGAASDILLLFSAGNSEAVVSDKRGMSPFYKASVTVT